MRPACQASPLPHLRVDQPCQLRFPLGRRVSGHHLQLGRQGLNVLLCIFPCSALGDDIRFQLADGGPVAIPSMADVTAHSRLVSRRDRSGTRHRELSCWQYKPASTLATWADRKCLQPSSASVISVSMSYLFCFEQAGLVCNDMSISVVSTFISRVYNTKCPVYIKKTELFVRQWRFRAASTTKQASKHATGRKRRGTCVATQMDSTEPVMSHGSGQEITRKMEKRVATVHVPLLLMGSMTRATWPCLQANRTNAGSGQEKETETQRQTMY